jgi:ketosteroid isomerase-like protein
MSNVETARRSIEAVNSGDLEALLETLDLDVTFEPQRAAVQGAYRGHAGVREWFADTQESFAEFQLEVTEIRDLEDDRVLMLGQLRVRGQGSGVETEVPSAFVIQFRDGKSFKLKDYGDHDRALEAAGLG